MAEFFIIKANHSQRTFSVHGPTSSDKSAIEDCTKAREGGQSVQISGGEGVTSRAQAVSEANHTYGGYKEISNAF